MIIARSSIVHMPPGHYAKIAQVIRNIVKTNRGYKWHTRRPAKRTRPHQPIGEHQIPKSKRVALILENERERVIEDDDPDELLELWNRPED